MRYKEDPLGVCRDIKRIKEELGLTHQEIAEKYPEFGITGKSARTIIGRVLNIDHFHDDIKFQMEKQRYPDWKELDKIIRKKSDVINFTLEEYKRIAGINIEELNVVDSKIEDETEKNEAQFEDMRIVASAGGSDKILHFPINQHKISTEKVIIDKNSATAKDVDTQTQQAQQEIEEESSTECAKNNHTKTETVDTHAQQSATKCNKIEKSGGCNKNNSNSVDSSENDATKEKTDATNPDLISTKKVQNKVKEYWRENTKKTLMSGKAILAMIAYIGFVWLSFPELKPVFEALGAAHPLEYVILLDACIFLMTIFAVTKGGFAHFMKWGVIVFASLFILVGTQTKNKNDIDVKVEESPIVKHALATYQDAKAVYEDRKSVYNSPHSKGSKKNNLYKNNWYYTKKVEPAKTKMDKAFNDWQTEVRKAQKDHVGISLGGWDIYLIGMVLFRFVIVMTQSYLSETIYESFRETFFGRRTVKKS